MINTTDLLELKKLLKTTNLQKGYQEQTKLFRSLRIFLEKEFSTYTFSGNIVENNMEYAYFQFTNENLKSKGLKLVIAFIYKDFEYEVWLSGYNRKIQSELQKKLSDTKLQYELTKQPNRTDYIVKHRLTNNPDYKDIDQLFSQIKRNSQEFIENVTKIVG